MLHVTLHTSTPPQLKRVNDPAEGEQLMQAQDPQPQAAAEAPRRFSAQWFREGGVNYVAKPAASALAGAVALSPLAIAVGLAMEDPDAFGAIAGVGAATGLAANVAKLAGQEDLSTGIMKCLGAFYRGEAMAIGSAPWAARFASLQSATNLALELGWEPEKAMTMVALMRVAMTVAYTMVVPAAAGTIGVVTSALQEGCARLADAGDTPLLVPNLQHTGKAVHTAFSVGATATLLSGLGANLVPGDRPPGPSEVFEKLVANLPGSPMAASSGIGFLVWANAMRPHMMEGGSWTNLSEEIKNTSKSIEVALDADVKAKTADTVLATQALEDAKGSYGVAVASKQGTAAIAAAKKVWDKAQAKYDKAFAAETAARSAVANKDTMCAKLRNTLTATIGKLKTEYVNTTAGSMTLGVTSPWHFAVQGGKLSQAAGLLGRGLTSPLTGLAVYSMCEHQLAAEKSHKEDPGTQAALLVFAYAGFLSYWMGVLFNWVDLKAPKAIAELNATPRTATTEGMRAMLMVVGTLGATYAFDKIFDEGIAGRQEQGEYPANADAVHLIGAGVIGLSATLIAHIVGKLGVDTTRASEVTGIAAASVGAGYLDAGYSGALSAAAGVLGAEILALFVRYKFFQDKADAVQEKGESELEKFLKKADAAKLEASAKDFAAELEKLTPEQALAEIRKLTDKVATGGRMTLENVQVTIHLPRDAVIAGEGREAGDVEHKGA